ncbi:hypothetical protein B0H11DRAFT_2057930 [Mycena galericulata]|nr:hypothetical protein B0H11DRAFT_2057930 [Mycena galericulata]
MGLGCQAARGSTSRRQGCRPPQRIILAINSDFCANEDQSACAHDFGLLADPTQFVHPFSLFEGAPPHGQCPPPQHLAHPGGKHLPRMPQRSIRAHHTRIKERAYRRGREEHNGGGMGEMLTSSLCQYGVLCRRRLHGAQHPTRLHNPMRRTDSAVQRLHICNCYCARQQKRCQLDILVVETVQEMVV